MKNATLAITAAFVGLALPGCANAGGKMTQSDSLGEFVKALADHKQTDLYPVKRISGGSGKIATGHARKDTHGVFVAGYVEKLGPGWVTGAWSHVDVVVLDSKGQPSQKVATKFFPSEVPATLRGITGRSRYSVKLPSVPPAGSTVQVIFHQVAMAQCESGQEL